MISTVTSAVVGTVSGWELTTWLGGLATVALIVLLIERQLLVAGGPRLNTLARDLTIVIAPLLVLFGAIVATRLLSLLGTM
jgi:hypothetical protein